MKKAKITKLFYYVKILQVSEFAICYSFCFINKISDISQLPEDIKGFLEANTTELTSTSVEIGAAQMTTGKIRK